MKVRVCYTIEVDDRYRRAVNAWVGKNGFASNRDLKDWFRIYGESCDDEVLDHLCYIESIEETKKILKCGKTERKNEKVE